MSKRFVIILAALILLFIGFLLFNKNGSDNKSTSDSNSATLSNHTYGNGSTGVVVMEYGDFQCPACYQYFPIVNQLKNKYKDQITFQFRHYPLVEIHQNALSSARAAEAAGLQGKFWKMHDALYTNQQEWAESTNPQPFFENYAKLIGLDVTKFQVDIKSESVNATIQADRNNAKSSGYSGTPTFVVDGKQIESPGSLDAFSKIIDEAIAAKSQQQ